MAGKVKNDLFESRSNGDVQALISEYPLSWVCARGGGADSASLLPLIGEYGEAGQLVSLIGHMARRNPLHQALVDDGRSVILFSGPQAYVSPSDVGNRAWAPTWNFAQVRLDAEISFESLSTKEALSILVSTMEQDRDNPWSIDELGDRYFDMAERIVSFRARIEKVCARFKLGQDEQPDIAKAMIATAHDPAMKSWMHRFKSSRSDRND